MDEVWKSAAQFLGALNGENIKRDSYVSTPEYREALAAWGKKEQEWEKLLAALPSDTAESLQEIYGKRGNYEDQRKNETIYGIGVGMRYHPFSYAGRVDSSGSRKLNSSQ